MKVAGIEIRTGEDALKAVRLLRAKEAQFRQRHREELRRYNTRYQRRRRRMQKEGTWKSRTA